MLAQLARTVAAVYRRLEANCAGSPVYHVGHNALGLDHLGVARDRIGACVEGLLAHCIEHPAEHSFGDRLLPVPSTSLCRLDREIVCEQLARQLCAAILVCLTRYGLNQVADVGHKGRIALLIQLSNEVETLVHTEGVAWLRAWR